jgi:outer membrane protein assembly factor BamB
MSHLTYRLIIGMAAAGIASAQFGGGPAWNVAGGDAQRTSWVRTDPKISAAEMQKPGFRLLWKVKVNNDARQDYSLSQAVEFPRYIGYRGFRSLAFFGGASNNSVAIDTDLGRIEWAHHFDGALPNGTATCPGGTIAGVSRPTPLTDNPLGTVQAGRAATHALSAVGEPHEGAVQVTQFFRAGGASGRGPRAPAAYGSNAVFALSADGLLHLEYVSNGEESEAPIRFLPANANASGLIFNETDVYVSTKNSCGGAPNAVWGIDLLSPEKKVYSWKTNGGSVVGTAFGTDGTVYASTGDGDYSPAAFSDSVVALDRKTLAMKDFFSPAKSAFTTSPMVLAFGGKYLIAVANQDGHIYLLDAASPGGADHRTPLASIAASVTTGELATWEANGTRWILAPVSGGKSAVAAFKVVDAGGKPSLQAAWVSRDMTVPQTPAIVNGVIFAVSGGDAQHPAVLYALDGATGRDVWNSGATMTSYARTGVSGGSSQLYLGTHDSTVYAFGFPLVPTGE